jgi:peptide/nickel transport system permease protein
MTTTPTKLEADPPQAPPDEVPRSARQIRWARRRRAIGRFWSEYRRSGMGMLGLAILVFFIGMATYSVFADDSGTKVTEVTAESLAPSCSFIETPCGPSAQFPLGTDDDGRSVLTLVIHGSRVSLLVGLAASAITMVVGAIVGIVAGYAAGRTDRALMVVTDMFLVLPFLALAIILAAILGQNIWVIIMIIGLTSWPGTARLVRAQTFSVKEHLYIERSRALGGSNWHVITRHVFPNVMPVIVANTILTVAIAILSESGLSFLGLGDVTRASWGVMIDSAFENGALTLGAWWWLLAPSFCIVLVVLGFTLCGYAMDEIINPRIRER